MRNYRCLNATRNRLCVTLITHRCALIAYIIICSRLSVVAKSIPEQELETIGVVVSAHTEGIAILDIQDALEENIARHTLQYRLKHLVDEGRLVRKGERHWARYLPSAAVKRPDKGSQSIRRRAGQRSAAVKTRS